MQHLDFVIWMIVFPITVSICKFIDSARGCPVSPESEGLGNLIMVALWLGVAYVLF